jgi:mortality factor 4-like protein 1
MPELIAQTNMDAQSVSKLREEMTRLTLWFSKHTDDYLNTAYVTPTAEYIERAKTF